MRSAISSAQWYRHVIVTVSNRSRTDAAGFSTATAQAPEAQIPPGPVASPEFSYVLPAQTDSGSQILYCLLPARLECSNTHGRNNSACNLAHEDRLLNTCHIEYRMVVCHEFSVRRLEEVVIDVIGGDRHVASK